MNTRSSGMQPRGVDEVQRERDEERRGRAEPGELAREPDQVQPDAERGAERHDLDFRFLRLAAEGEQVEERQPEQEVDAEVERGRRGSSRPGTLRDVFAGEVDQHRRDERPPQKRRRSSNSPEPVEREARGRAPPTDAVARATSRRPAVVCLMSSNVSPKKPASCAGPRLAPAVPERTPTTSPPMIPP